MAAQIQLMLLITSLINLYFCSRYLNTYKKYQDLLNNKAETEINTFIQDEPVLLALSKVSRYTANEYPNLNRMAILSII